MRDNTYIVITSWMRSELNLSGNDLLVYAVIYGFSQDGESRFTGSRQYLADWCGCTTRSVQTILNDLTDRGLLTKYEQVVNGVKQCQYVANFTTREKISPAHENISPNNINNKLDSKYTSSITRSSINTTTPNIGGADTIKNNKNGTEDSIETEDDVESHGYSPEELRKEFLGSAKKGIHAKVTGRKQSLYSKCESAIVAYTKDGRLIDALTRYLPIRFAIHEKPIYGINQWTALLKRLDNTPGDKVQIVEQSIEKGWCSFYEVKDNTRTPAGELNSVVCKKSEEEIIDEKF